MNDYDLTSKAAVRLNPSSFFRWLLGDAVRLIFRDWYETTPPPLPGDEERICDTVALFDDPDDPEQPVAIDLEFQTENDSEILERMLEYIARLRRSLRRRGFQVLGALVNLTGTPQRDTLEMTMPGRPEVGLRLRIVLRTLREEAAAATLGAIAAGTVARCVLPWIPLMRGAGEAAIIEKWKELAAAEPDVNYRADYGAMAEVFARLTDHHDAWQEALKEWLMIKSPFLEEIRAEERVRVLRDDLLRALTLRYQTTIPADLKAAVEASTIPEELKRWFDTVFTAPDLDAFRAAIGH